MRQEKCAKMQTFAGKKEWWLRGVGEGGRGILDKDMDSAAGSHFMCERCSAPTLTLVPALANGNNVSISSVSAFAFHRVCVCV